MFVESYCVSSALLWHRYLMSPGFIEFLCSEVISFDPCVWSAFPITLPSDPTVLFFIILATIWPLLIYIRIHRGHETIFFMAILCL